MGNWVGGLLTNATSVRYGWVQRSVAGVVVTWLKFGAGRRSTELTSLRGLRQASGAHGHTLVDRVLGTSPPSSRMQSKVKNDRTG